MSANEIQPNDENVPNVGDQNVERLLGKAYQPETPDSEFVKRVEALMVSAAREGAEARAHESPRVTIARRPAYQWRKLAWSAVAATILVGVGFVVGRQMGRPAGIGLAIRPAELDRTLDTLAVQLVQAPVTDARFLSYQFNPEDSRTNVVVGDRGLTPRPRPAAPATELLAIGAELHTEAGQRRRVMLADDSILFLNENTHVSVEAERQIALRTGEIYVEVSPRVARPETETEAGESNEVKSRETPATFVVKSAGREITALGTKFAVRAGAENAHVLVTQGKVQVNDVSQPIVAGQQIAVLKSLGDVGPDNSPPAVSLLPRASHVLDWTRDLVAAAESPLVPASEHAGGSIVARDPNGQEARLSLRTYHVDVHIEDGFARTTIDQTYFNHTSWRLEGTFHFPLPPDASLSRLAMYVEGKLMEGGMAERNYAREVFEKIVRTQKDPALLEWVDGSTFKMRVFPLEARQEKRIVLSYTQRLDTLYGNSKYRFPAGHSLDAVRDWSFHARVKRGAELTWSCDSHELKDSKDGNDLVLNAEAKEVKLDRDVVLRLTDRQQPLTTHHSQLTSSSHDGHRYLMLRFRPDLPTKAQRQRRDWVFLFESSGDRDPVLARVQVDVIKTLLQNAEHDDTFTILTAGTQVRAFAKELLPATPENVKQAVEFLDGVHLVGALDIGQALAAAEPFVKSGKNAYLVHVGSGMPVLGERSEDKLLKRIPAGARYVGVGVGKRWSRQFMKTAASRTGGYFTQINPDEPVAWRAFDLYSTLNTPRLLNATVVDHAERIPFLVYNDSIAHGEELCAIARLAGGNPLPEKITVSGTLDGEPFRRVITVENVAPNADYLPRTWAKLRIDQLLADDAAKHKDEIILLSKAMYVMSPFTSLLVLESDQMYVQFNIDRGRKDHWAMYRCPKQIPVVYEPLASPPAVAQAAPQAQPVPTKPSVPHVLGTILVRLPPQFATWPNTKSHYGLSQTYLRLLVCPDDNGDGYPDYPNMYLAGLREDRTPWFFNFVDFGGRLPNSGTWASEGDTPGATLPLSGLSQADRARISKQLRQFFSPSNRSEGVIVGNPQYPPIASDYAMMNGSIPILWDVETGGRYVPGKININTLYDPELLDSLARFRNRFGAYPPGQIILNGRGDRLGEVGIDRMDLGRTDSVWIGLGVPVQQTIEEQSFKPLLAYLNFDLDGKLNLNAHGNMNFQTLGSGYSLTEINLQNRFSGFSLGVNVLDLDSPFPGRWANPHPRFQTFHFSDDYVNYQRLEEYNARLGAAERLVTIQAIPVEEWRMAKVNVDINELLARQLAESRQIAAIRGRSLLRDMYGTGDDAEATYYKNAFSGTFGRRLTLRQRAEERGLRLGGKFFFDESARSHEQGEDTEDVLAFTVRLAQASSAWNRWQTLMYQRPSFNADTRHFSDLITYAPGMNTSRADVLAVLENEVEPQRNRLAGDIEPLARAIIDKARGAGWQTLTLPASDGRTPLVIAFDGSGRFGFDRTTEEGLRERVVCDATTLWHLYPELGIGAKRNVSRFHRAEFLSLVPWLLPTVEDLARDADLLAINERTIAIVPRGAKPAPPRVANGQNEKAEEAQSKLTHFWSIHLIFAEDGRLAERRLVAMPAGKVLARETYTADGIVKLLDGDDKVLAENKLSIEPAVQPDLSPNTKNLVVLPMPVRTIEHVYQSSKQPRDGRFGQWSEDDALKLLVANMIQDPSAVMQIVGQRFFAKGDRRAGFYTLLMASGRTWDPQGDHVMADGSHVRFDPVADHPDSPLARYVFLHQQQMTKSGKIEEMDLATGPGGGFIEQLAAYRDLHVRWTSGKATQGGYSEKEHQRAMEFVRASKSPRFGWSVLTMLQNQSSGVEWNKVLAELHRKFEQTPGLEYAARYERAYCVYQTGEGQPAKELFRELHAETLKRGVLPPVDQRFRQAFQDGTTGPAMWAALWRDAAEKVTTQGDRTAALALAWQCHKLGDMVMADELFATAMRGVADDERPAMTLAAVDYLARTEQYARADALLQTVLEDERFGQLAWLWRVGAGLAEKQGMTARSVARLDRAMDIEYSRLPDEVDLESVRAAFSSLLERYQRLADSIASLGSEPPPELVGRVIRAADRWRSLDPDDTAACQTAARVLQRLGTRDAAWEYVTTPLADRSGEAPQWSSLAGTLRGQNEFDLADRAYRSAFDTEPTNAQVLWDHAQMLEQRGQADAARQFYRKIAESSWGPEFLSVQEQARKLVGTP